MTAPKVLPTRTLREHPDLEQLKRQAKELLEAYLAGKSAAVAEVEAHYRDANRATFALHDAQLVLARAHGFDSWSKLKARVDGVTVRRLCEAVDRGDVTAARDLLGRRPEIVNFEWHGELRALHLALFRQDLPMVRLLMESGADARIGVWPNRDATSVLTIATERGYDDIVSIIKEAERRRRDRAGDSHTAPTLALDELLKAIGRRDEERAMAMLDADSALLNARHPDGWTPLHLAAATLNERLVTWLLKHGANVNLRATGDWAPIDVAASGWWWGKTGTPAHFMTVAKVLLKAGADRTAITAVALGDVDWLQAQHAEGALEGPTHLNMFRPFGGLLTIAATHDRLEVMRLLLDLGFDPDERVRVGQLEEAVYSSGGPLHCCAGAGKLAMAELLLDRGADPNANVYTSGSPTYVAYRQADPAMIRLLERHGGKIDAASVGYLRQTELARKMLKGEIDAGLEFGTFSGKTVAEQLLWSGASGGDPEIVRMSLERIDWSRDDTRWFWLLWRPLPGHRQQPEADGGAYLTCFGQILARCGPNIRAPQFGQTMLHEVVARDQDDGVAFATMLLDAGARTDVRDDLLKSTPLGWACRWGRADLVTLLVARGADPLESDAEPWATPRAWAEKKGHSAVLALLLQD